MLFRTIMFLATATVLPALSPDQALNRLMEGNKRFMSDKPRDSFSLSARREETLNRQSPFAVILGCSDSRVPPEIVFNEGVGDLFVVRTAGNVVSSVELDSIRYAIQYLQSNLILVMGHQNCGAVTAVVEGNTADIQAVADLVSPKVREASTLEEAVKINVRSIVHSLRRSSRFKKLYDEKKIDIRGAYYHFQSGKVELL